MGVLVDLGDGPDPDESEDLASSELRLDGVLDLSKISAGADVHLETLYPIVSENWYSV